MKRKGKRYANLIMRKRGSRNIISWRQSIDGKVYTRSMQTDDWDEAAEVRDRMLAEWDTPTP